MVSIRTYLSWPLASCIVQIPTMTDSQVILSRALLTVAVAVGLSPGADLSTLFAIRGVGANYRLHGPLIAASKGSISLCTLSNMIQLVGVRLIIVQPELSDARFLLVKVLGGGK